MTAFRAAFKAYRMHQVLLLPRFARLTIALGLATAVFPVDAEDYFNPRFLSNDLANLSIYPPLLRDARHHLVHIGSTFI